MKFQIQTKTLKTALENVNHATGGIIATPILENILIKVNFTNIVFTSNNLEMAVEYVVFQNIKIEHEGYICIPSRIFFNYVNLLEDDYVNIELLNNNSIEIKTDSSKIIIKGNSPNDFPLIPKIKETTIFTLKSDVLKKAIEKTLFSSAEGNIRPTLAGIYINIENKIAKFASTDSLRLSEYKVNIEEKISGNFTQIIPNKTAFELKNMLIEKNDIKIIVGENQIGFFFGNTKIYSRLLNGQYPEYEGFFPTSYNTRAIINKIDLIQGLKKINLLSKETNYATKISISNETGILIETSQTQMGEARINLIGSVEGEEAIIGLNSGYLFEVLGIIETSHVSISFESPLSPILITGISQESNDFFRHIIMPLKI